MATQSSVRSFFTWQSVTLATREKPRLVIDPEATSAAEVQIDLVSPVGKLGFFCVCYKIAKRNGKNKDANCGSKEQQHRQGDKATGSGFNRNQLDGRSSQEGQHAQEGF